MSPKALFEDLDTTYNSSYFLKDVIKMADIDIDLFGEHDKIDEHSDEGETIPFTLGGVIGEGTWEPEHEQETSSGGMNLKTKVLRECVKGLYGKLSERMGQTPEAFHFDDFKIRDGTCTKETRTCP